MTDTTQTYSQAAAAAAVQMAPAPSQGIMDDILDQTVRRQAEQAKADALMGRTYGPGMGMSEASAALKIACGRDFGFGPAQSLTMIHLVDGNPTLAAVGRSNLLKKAGYDWRPEGKDGLSAKVCRLRFYRHGEEMRLPDGSPLILAFSMDDAIQAGYVEKARGKGTKGNYDKVPANMLFARCITNFHRWFAAEVDGSQLMDPNEITLEDVMTATEARVASKALDAAEALKERLQTVTAAPAAEEVAK